jgi:periplasmic divalent cation tolerance protein
MSDPAALVVLSTCPREAAAGLAERLVAERVAACVNVVPAVESFYVWEGKLNRDAESLLIIKTAPDRLPALQEAILRAHPYQVPEVVVLDVKGGNPKYLEWVAAMTRSA